MKLCILTYDAPHLKTAQILTGLNFRSYSTVDLMLMPFFSRPQRHVLFEHRPKQFLGPTPQSLVNRYGGRIINYDDWKSVVDEYDYFIVGGSNLIAPDFANSGKIINVHSGLIPNVRGLDSFKWAIHDEKPVGNTLHIINSETDAGKIVFHRRTDIFLEDDIDGFARRHYENEIQMLIDFERLLESAPPVLPADSAPTKRMPLEIEKIMLERFDHFKALMRSADSTN